MTRQFLSMILVYLFSDGSDDDLLKINASDGTLAWTYNAPTGSYDLIIATADAVYLFNDGNDDLLKINTSDGNTGMDI